MSLRGAKRKNEIPRFSRNRLRNLRTGSKQTSQCQQEIAQFIPSDKTEIASLRSNDEILLFQQYH